MLKAESSQPVTFMNDIRLTQFSHGCGCKIAPALLSDMLSAVPPGVLPPDLMVGMPIDKLPAEIISRIMEGGASVCRAAGIPVAG